MALLAPVLELALEQLGSRTALGSAAQAEARERLTRISTAPTVVPALPWLPLRVSPGSRSPSVEPVGRLSSRKLSEFVGPLAQQGSACRKGSANAQVSIWRCHGVNGREEAREEMKVNKEDEEPTREGNQKEGLIPRVCLAPAARIPATWSPWEALDAASLQNLQQELQRIAGVDICSRLKRVYEVSDQKGQPRVASMDGKGAGVPVPLLKATSEFTRIGLLLASPTSVSKKSFSSFPFFHLSL